MRIVFVLVVLLAVALAVWLVIIPLAIDPLAGRAAPAPFSDVPTRADDPRQENPITRTAVEPSSPTNIDSAEGPVFARYLEGVGVFEAIVVDDRDSPVADLPVRLVPFRYSPLRLDVNATSTDWSTVTGSDGRFRCPSLEFGRYVVELGPRDAVHRQEVEYRYVARVHTLRFDRRVRQIAVRTTVDGALHDVDGVFLDDTPMAPATSESRGTYIVEVSMGRRAFELRAERGDATRTIRERNLDTDFPHVEYRFEFPKDASLDVALEGAPEERLRGSILEMRSTDGKEQVLAATVHGSTARFDAVMTGKYCFALVRAEGLGIVDAGPPVRCGFGGVSSLSLRVGAAGAIRGFVVAEDGASLPERVVVAALVDEIGQPTKSSQRAFPSRRHRGEISSWGSLPWLYVSDSRTVQPDAQGRFEIDGLPTGRYRVRALPSHGYGSWTDVRLKPGDPTEVRLRVAPGCEVEGHTLGNRVILRNSDREIIARVGGTRFRFDPVPAGRYEIRVERGREAIEFGSVDLPENGHEYLDLLGRGPHIVRVTWPYAGADRFRWKFGGKRAAFRSGVAELRFPFEPRIRSIRVESPSVSHLLRVKPARIGGTLAITLPMPTARISVAAGLAGETVEITSRLSVRGPGSTWSTVADASPAGHDVFPGACEVRTTGDSMAAIWFGELKVGDRVALDRADLSPLGRVRVRVRDTKGRSLDGFLVSASARDPAMRDLASTTKGSADVWAPMGARVTVSARGGLEDDFTRIALIGQKLWKKLQITEPETVVDIEVDLHKARPRAVR